jgi:general stress protein YciG
MHRASWTINGTVSLLRRAIVNDTPKSKRGFASLSPERRREIARKGGQSVPPENRSFSQNTELAIAAGRKGGQNVQAANRSFSKNPTLASEAGKKGGHASHGGGGKKR